jgi:carbon monoxide dehydrogenase subunit G
MILLTLTAAFAGAPEAHVVTSTLVEGSVSVRAPAPDVRRWLGDPNWVSSVDGGQTSVTITGREGSCLLADYVADHSVMKVTYSVRQCPSSEGHVAVATKSNAFDTYRAEWRVVPEGTGSLVTYRLDIDTSLWFPNSFVTSTTRGAVERLLKRLQDRVGAP